MNTCQIRAGLTFVILIVTLCTFTMTFTRVFQVDVSSVSLNYGASYVPGADDVTVNLQSPMSSDIMHIWHHSDSASISVDLRSGSNCTNPFLRGRLSGPALGIIEWQPSSVITNTNDYRVTGKYTVPFAGVYSIEILVLLCEHFIFEQNFTNICLQQPLLDTITAAGAIVVVNIPRATTDAGYWVAESQARPLPPLLTRFQSPQRKCRKPNNITADFCQQHMSLTRFEPYKFQWNSTIQIRNNSKHMMCVVGSSHARVIYKFWERNAEKYGISARYIHLHYPNQLTEKFIVDRIIGAGCIKVVIGVGQWPAGWPGGSPTLFPRFEDEMHAAITTAQRLLRGKCSLFIRNGHYNPLGDSILKYPPTDWRSPPVIDGYNRILTMVCHVLGVPFIDTDFIIGPMWDSAQDWCHYKNNVGEMDALFILQKMLETK